MNSPVWTGGRLIAAAAVLAAAGALLLHAGVQGASVPDPAVSPAVTAGSASGPAPEVVPAAPSPAGPAPSDVGSKASPAPELPQASEQQSEEATPMVGELPPPGSGPGADPLIQQALDQASRADLPPGDERHLLETARSAWLAETSAYTQVRIQAATARRDTSPGGGGAEVRAVVRLVWAGADPAGTLLDGRTAALYYTQTGDGSWKRT
ncbi:hypothetical protein [Streptomyces xanthophaeus]